MLTPLQDLPFEPLSLVPFWLPFVPCLEPSSSWVVPPYASALTDKCCRLLAQTMQGLLCVAENPKILTQCNHHFHLACIYEWLERSQTCPICSREMSFDEFL